MQKIIIVFFTFLSLQLFSKNNLTELKCKAELVYNPFKFESLYQIGRDRITKKTSDFKYNILVFQYYLPFQFQIKKQKDSICINEYCQSLFVVRPTIFYYKGFNTDFGAGLGIKISNIIYKNIYWSYQIGLGWFEGERTRGIDVKGLNFLHLFGINFLLHKNTTLFINAGHISNGGLFKYQSLQDFFGLGLSYQLFSKKNS